MKSYLQDYGRTTFVSHFFKIAPYVFILVSLPKKITIYLKWVWLQLKWNNIFIFQNLLSEQGRVFMNAILVRIYDNYP